MSTSDSTSKADGDANEARNADRGGQPAHVLLRLAHMEDDELSDLAASGDSLAHRIYGERLMRRRRLMSIDPTISMTQGAIEDSAYYRRRLREVLREGHAEAAVGIYAGSAFRSLDRLYDPDTWAACRRQETP